MGFDLGEVHDSLHPGHLLPQIEPEGGGTTDSCNQDGFFPDSVRLGETFLSPQVPLVEDKGNRPKLVQTAGNPPGFLLVGVSQSAGVGMAVGLGNPAIGKTGD